MPDPQPPASAVERALRLLLVAVVLVPALIFAGAALLSYELHFAEAQARLARGADIVYEQSAKVFETIDLVAGRVDEMLAGLDDDAIRAREAEFHARAKALAAPLEQVQFVLVIDRQGHPLLFSALFPTVRSTDYSGRDYFQAMRDATLSGQSFVSAVLQGRLRTDNTTFLIAVRRGATLGGSGGGEAGAGPAPFDGVIAISTTPAYFTGHFRQIAGPDLDTVTLVRADGAVLARFPGALKPAERPSPPLSLLGAVARNPLQGNYETVSVFDGVRRLYAYRRLPHHPIYVTVGIDRATVLAAWRATLARYLAFGVPATGGLVLLALTALRRARGEAVALVRLADRTRELDQVWRTSRDLFAMGGHDGILRSVNPAWGGTLGFASAEVAGKALASFVHPEDVPAVTQAVARVAAGEVVRDVDVRLRAKDGSDHWLSWTWVPEGELFYASGRDITDRRRLSEQLRQAQKMEAVGQLTGGIAHDFNNMLAVVIGSLELLGRRVGDGDARVRRYVDAAADGARRAALLTQRLLAFSRQQPLKPEPVDVAALVGGMAELIRGSVGSAIRLDIVASPDTWRTHVDSNQLENVLLNLVVNARDAMPEGGRLLIETGNAELDDRYAAAHSGVRAGQYGLIAVTDTGFGMPREVIAKAFDPFFTTKDVGKGTGLGLSQVYGFVQQSGGHVKIYSESGQGTAVKIYLPRLLDAAGGPARQATLAAPAAARLGEVVLVVEDEAMVRQLSVETLNELGYQVLEADGAATAMRLLEAHPEVTLLFTDVVMPDVSGARLAEQARQHRPDLKILFTTGYTRNAMSQTGLLGSGPDVDLIGKPFTLDEIAAKLRKVLDAPPRTGVIGVALP